MSDKNSKSETMLSSRGESRVNVLQNLQNRTPPIKDSDAGWEKINLQNFAEVEKAVEFSGRWT